MRVFLSLAVMASAAIACGDVKCADTEVCLPVCDTTTSNVAGTVKQMTCVVAQGVGDSCGGHTMECKQEVCGAGLVCDFSAEYGSGIADLAGKCAVECKADSECSMGQICRATCDSSASVCVDAQADGESCGGHTMECKEQRCGYALSCDFSENDPLIADLPGKCAECLVCPQTFAPPTCKDCADGRCIVSSDSCFSCAAAVCMDEPAECVICTQAIPTCESDCTDCKVLPGSCSACSEAVCMDEPAECNTVCAEIYDPVCSGERKFSNRCEFSAAKCLAKADWTVQACVADACTDHKCTGDAPICTPVQCITTPCDQYSCSAAAHDCKTREVWTEEKSAWCCKNQQLGCAEADACDGVTNCCPKDSTCTLPRGGNAKQCVGPTDRVLDASPAHCVVEVEPTEAEETEPTEAEETEPTEAEEAEPTEADEHNCMSKELWTDEKREWCCKNKKAGCDDEDAVEQSGAQAASASLLAVCLALMQFA